MSQSVFRRLYRQARAKGYAATYAIRIARVASAFYDRSDVRLEAQPEEESYFAGWGQPEGYVNGYGRRVSAKEELAELEHLLETNGNYCVFSEYLDARGDWQLADSIGHCMGYDDPTSPVENCYVVDLMEAAMNAADSLCPAI